MEKQSAKNAQYNNEHYKKCIIEPLVVMKKTMTPEEYLGFLKGNVLKYRLRAGLKDGNSAEDDLRKAMHYEELYRNQTEGVYLKNIALQYKETLTGTRTDR